VRPSPGAPPAAVGGGPAPEADDARWSISVVFSFALIVGAYFTFRFSGRWVEGDTASQADNIRAMIRDMTILSPSGVLYSNGYAFSAVSTFIVAFTGVKIETLLQLIYPLVSATLVLVAWPVYREFTGSARAATVATLILFVQPEFLFVILRGSHERVLRVFLLLSMWLLLRSFRHADKTPLYATYVFLFYLTVYGTIATNSWFGSSYVWALATALVGSWVARWLGPGLRPVSLSTQRRLLYVPIFAGVLAFLFNSYIYPPSGQTLGQIPSILDRLSRLMLTTSPDPSTTRYNAYAAIFDQWVDIRVYFLLSLGTYLLLAGSAALWIRMGLRWLAGVGDRPTLGRWLLWLLYGASALQGAMSVVADNAGMLGGNLQYRSFPTFVMMASPIVAIGLTEWRPKPRTRVLASGALGILALLGIAKATNDPAVSNGWSFYLPSEVSALRFLGDYMKEGQLYWSDFDERLRALRILVNASNLTPTLDPNAVGLRTYLISDIIRARAARLGRPVPPVTGELRIYDDGDVQIYRKRSLTPYQD